MGKNNIVRRRLLGLAQSSVCDNPKIYIYPVSGETITYNGNTVVGQYSTSTSVPTSAQIELENIDAVTSSTQTVWLWVSDGTVGSTINVRYRSYDFPGSTPERDLSGTYTNTTANEHHFIGLGTRIPEGGAGYGLIEAYATKTGYMDSATITKTIYNSHCTISTPVITPHGGTGLTHYVTVTITCPSPGVEIRFVVSSTPQTPTSASNLYQGPINLTNTVWVTAKAFLNGRESSTDSAYFEFSSGPGQDYLPPVISPGTCNFNGSIAITFTNNNPGGTIRYTTNGNVPTLNNSIIISNGGSITLTETTTVKAKIFYDNTSTALTTETYTKNGFVITNKVTETIHSDFRTSCGTYIVSEGVSDSMAYGFSLYSTDAAGMYFTTDGTELTASNYSSAGTYIGNNVFRRVTDTTYVHYISISNHGEPITGEFWIYVNKIRTNTFYTGGNMFLGSALPNMTYYNGNNYSQYNMIYMYVIDGYRGNRPLLINDPSINTIYIPSGDSSVPVYVYNPGGIDRAISVIYSYSVNSSRLSYNGYSPYCPIQIQFSGNSTSQKLNTFNQILNGTILNSTIREVYISSNEKDTFCARGSGLKYAYFYGNELKENDPFYIRGITSYLHDARHKIEYGAFEFCNLTSLELGYIGSSLTVGWLDEVGSYAFAYNQKKNGNIWTTTLHALHLGNNCNIIGDYIVYSLGLETVRTPMIIGLYNSRSIPTITSHTWADNATAGLYFLNAGCTLIVKESQKCAYENTWKGHETSGAVYTAMTIVGDETFLTCVQGTTPPSGLPSAISSEPPTIGSDGISATVMINTTTPQEPITMRGIILRRTDNATAPVCIPASSAGSGSATVEMRPLTPTAKYIYYAFAINSIGMSIETSYHTFTVPSLVNAPCLDDSFSIAHMPTSNINTNTIIASAYISDNGGASVTQCGFILKYSHNPHGEPEFYLNSADTSTIITSMQTGGSMSINVTDINGLRPNPYPPFGGNSTGRVWVKAFARNIAGIGYTRAKHLELSNVPDGIHVYTPTSTYNHPTYVQGTNFNNSYLYCPKVGYLYEAELQILGDKNVNNLTVSQSEILFTFYEAAPTGCIDSSIRFTLTSIRGWDPSFFPHSGTWYFCLHDLITDSYSPYVTVNTNVLDTDT